MVPRPVTISTVSRFSRAASVASVVWQAGCILNSDPYLPPSPADRVAFEARLAADSTDVDAVVALAVFDLGDARAESAARLLQRTVVRAPDDPVVPLLLAVAEEARSISSARVAYGNYARGRGGALAEWARARMDALEVAAVTEEVRRALAAPAPDLTQADSRSVVVLPFAYSSGDQIEQGLATALSTLVTSDLRRRGQWDLVDDRRARIALREMRIASESLLDLAVAASIGPYVGARHVVQGRFVPAPADSVIWEVTVTTLTAGAEPTVARFAIKGAVTEASLMERRMPNLIRNTLDGEQLVDELSPRHAELEVAMVAFGNGVMALDRDDQEAAEIAFERAFALDSTFLEAGELQVRTAAVTSTRIVPLPTQLAEIARVGERQRAVLALQMAGGSAHQQALSRVGARERPLLADALGLDAFGANVLLEIRLVPLGGGAP